MPATSPPHHRRAAAAGLNDRAYVIDGDRWIRSLLRSAVAASGCAGRGGFAGEAMAQMRFLVYNEAGGGLPPHVDLSRTDLRGRTTTHTFILYLTHCREGGETVLLERIAKPSAVLAEVTPARGRLLVFPHACPHMAREVVAHGLPKLLLRGEML